MSALNVAAVRQCTTAEGPGRRFAIWLQGCLKRCRGCCNPEMQALVRRHVVAVDDVAELIDAAKDNYGIEGVSFIGGEPFLQAGGAAELARRCHSMDLSTLVFSGYTLDELRASGKKDWERLLDATDILVDGPYLQDCPDARRGWVGSANQCVYFLTDRYCAGVEYEVPESVEYLVTSDELLMNGSPWLAAAALQLITSTSRASPNAPERAS